MLLESNMWQGSIEGSLNKAQVYVAMMLDVCDF